MMPFNLRPQKKLLSLLLLYISVLKVPVNLSSSENNAMFKLPASSTSVYLLVAGYSISIHSQLSQLSSLRGTHNMEAGISQQGHTADGDTVKVLPEAVN